MDNEQLSKTAAYLPIKFYGLTRIPKYRSLFTKPVLEFYESVVRFLPPPLNYYQYLLRYKWVRTFFIRWEELLLPGDLLHVIARKWFIQQMVNQLVEKGYEQLIVLGAGFDHLGYFFTAGDLTCVEVDIPGMAQGKSEFLKKKYPMDPHPMIIPARLDTDSLETLLQETPQIHPDKPTAIVAEGFFDYLSYHNVESLFITINDYFSHNISIISTHFSLDELPRHHRFVYENSVKMAGVKLQLKTSYEGYKQLLRGQQFKIQQLYDRQAIRETIRSKITTSLPVLKGFYIMQIFKGKND